MVIANGQKTCKKYAYLQKYLYINNRNENHIFSQHPNIHQEEHLFKTNSIRQETYFKSLSLGLLHM